MNYLKQKASNGLVLFVFGCTIIVVGLLYILQKSEAKRVDLQTKSTYLDYLD